jgi:membrane carboxypeptidase/penicillin-binding protein PbpC
MKTSQSFDQTRQQQQQHRRSIINRQSAEQEDYVKVNFGKAESFEKIEKPSISSEWVNVDVKPRILVQLTDKRIEMNTRAVFVCEFYCQSEKFEINWYHNGCVIKQFQSGEKKFVIKNDTDRSILCVLNVQNEDMGTYECRITNEKGTASSSAHLYVTKSKLLINLKTNPFDP